MVSLLCCTGRDFLGLIGQLAIGILLYLLASYSCYRVTAIGGLHGDFIWLWGKVQMIKHFKDSVNM